MRYPIQYIEIIRDKCTRTFGTSPCLAKGAQCYNTIGTCKYLSAYNGSTQKDIFINPDNTDASIYAQLGVNSVYPFLRSVKHTPATINPASAKQGSTALGTRATLRISLMDAASDDQHQDPYFLARSGNPDELGTFFTKYFARNKYLQYRQLNWVNAEIENGIVVNKKTRSYLITEIAGPDGKGGVSITAQDPLCLVELRKAKFPKVTTATLFADVDENATNLILSSDTINGQLGGLADYPMTWGYIRIDDEIIQYQSRTADGVLQTVTRGFDGTVKAAHSAGTTVQRVHANNTNSLVAFLSSVLGAQGAGIPAQYLDTAQWTNEQNNTEPWMQSTYRVRVPEPTGVNELLSDFMRQVGFIVYYDEDAAKVRIKVLTDVTPVKTLDDNESFIAESFKLQRADNEALTRVNLYVGVHSWVGDLKDPANYRNKIVLLAGNEEGSDRRGLIVDTDVFAYFLTDHQADLLGRNILRQFANAPEKYNFKLDAKDTDLIASDIVSVNHRLLIDSDGQRVTKIAQITKTQEDIAGTQWAYEAVSFNPFVMPDYKGHYFVFIPVSVNNRVLRTLFNEAKPSVTLQSGDKVTFVVGSGVTIGSTSTASVALSTGSWPAGVELELDCTAGGVWVIGKGGKGGDAIIAISGSNGTMPTISNVDGGNGGAAMAITAPMTIIGSPTIAGGGGGGGGAAAICLLRQGTPPSDSYPYLPLAASVSSGSGGAGFGEKGNAQITGFSPEESDIKFGHDGTKTASTPPLQASAIYDWNPAIVRAESYAKGGGGGVTSSGTPAKVGTASTLMTRGNSAAYRQTTKKGAAGAAGAAVSQGNNLLTAPNAIFYGARNN